MFMLRRYSCVEIDVVFAVSVYGEVSVSSPTCVVAKSPGTLLLSGVLVYGLLVCCSGAGQKPVGFSAANDSRTCVSRPSLDGGAYRSAKNRGNSTMPAPGASGEFFASSFTSALRASS